MQTESVKKSDIVTGGRIAENLFAEHFKVKLSEDQYDPEKDFIFLEDYPQFGIRKNDKGECKKSNPWHFPFPAVTTPYKGARANNTIKCTSGKVHLLFAFYQTPFRVNSAGTLHPLAEIFWNDVLLLKVIDPTKWFVRKAEIWEHGKRTGNFREALCWDLKNCEVMKKIHDPELANSFRKYSNAATN